MELPTLSRTPTSLNRHRFQIGPVIQAAESPDNPHNYDPKKKSNFSRGETPLYIPETNTSAELEKLGKPPTEVVTDYIASIYKHAFSRMESKVPSTHLKMCQKELVVSVSAVWSAEANGRDTRRRLTYSEGVVLSQLLKEAAIMSTVATKHLGLAANALHDAREDQGQRTTIDMYTRQPLLSKDVKMTCLPHNYPASMLIFTDELFECSLDTAPKYPRPGRTIVNCKVTADLRGVSKHHFESKVGVDGTTYVDVSYDLVVSMKTAIMKFSLEVGGKEKGSVQASYD
ncbi:MAG: hypothetical protein Q9203_004704 [Teloschistes exilis]